MSTRAGSVRTTRRRLQAVDAHTDDTSSGLSGALPRLAAALDEAAEQEGWGRPPLLVRVTAWPSKPLTEGFDLGVRPIDGEMTVVEALAGFTAPDEWLAIGVVTEGNARHLADPEEQRRVRCVHLVDRSGASGSTLRLQGAEASVLSSADEHDPSGRIDDVCRRSLGLSTAAPVHGSVELWAILWLERLLEYRGCVPAEMPLPWRDVAELHPAVALVVNDDDEWEAKAVQNVARLGEILADVHSWPVLRLACAAGEWPVDGVTPEVAEWLDDGAFSRWVLGAFPPLEQLAAAALEVVPPSVARRLRAALRG
ncbi:MAG: hypothetical protein QOI95_1680 [Acidimicrobiaceae bacterium]|jgi:hypothetical protein